MAPAHPVRPAAAEAGCEDFGVRLSGRRRLSALGPLSVVLREERVRLAERYLAADAYPLTQIAHLLGFTAPSAFSVWFRGHFGTTASEWRQRTRPGPRSSLHLEGGAGDRG